MDQALLDDFLAAAWSQLSSVEEGLSTAGDEAPASASLGNVSRNLRDLTVSCTFVGFGRTARLSRAIEARIERAAHDSPARIATDAATRTALDRLMDVLTGIEATRSEESGDDAAILDLLATEPLATAAEEPACAHVDSAPNLAAPEPDCVTSAASAGEAAPLRLHAATVDELLDLVGELDHTRNILLEIVVEEPPSRFTLPVSELDRVTTRLEEFVLDRIEPVAEGRPTAPVVAVSAPPGSEAMLVACEDVANEEQVVIEEDVAIEEQVADDVTQECSPRLSELALHAARRPFSGGLLPRSLLAIEFRELASPAATAAAPSPPASVSADEEFVATPAPRRRALVVDDSLLYRQLVRATLEQAGFEVDTAESADEAMPRIAAGAGFDVITSDVEMPGTDGPAFAAWIRDHVPDERPWLVAHTSLEAVHEPRLLAAGFDRYVRKFRAGALLGAVVPADRPATGLARRAVA